MKSIASITLAAFLAIASTAAFSLAADVSPAPSTPPEHTTNPKEYNVTNEKLALAGYDPVSYFKTGPVEGNKQFTAQLDGITYRFASDENRKAFLAEPEKYKPAYGGWCATAMSYGKKVEVDPKNYKISNGRLYLFFKAWYDNALNDWNKDEKNLMVRADQAWKKISGE